MTTPWDYTEQSDMSSSAVNPYEAQMNYDAPKVQGATKSLSTQMSNQPNLPEQSAYPAYPNTYGLGAPINPAKPEPQQVQANPNALQGANPWSLIGESNVRGE
jgi:hypothetical protein